jgi:hypothetical protein
MSTDGVTRNAARPSGSGIYWSTVALIDEESSPPWSRFSSSLSSLRLFRLRSLITAAFVLRGAVGRYAVASAAAFRTGASGMLSGAVALLAGNAMDFHRPLQLNRLGDRRSEDRG